MSHKGEKRRNYTMEFKGEVIEYAEKNSNHKASEKIHVAVRRIREWRQNKLKIFEPTVKPKNKGLDSGGKKPLGLQLENQLVGWIYDRRSNGLSVSSKFIMAKMKYFYEMNLMKVRNLLLWRAMGGSTISCVVMVLHSRRFSIKYKYPPLSIIAMDETSVWNDMVSNITTDKQGATSVCLKTTRHEKCMVSVFLAAKADGTKLKPFVVFRAAKRESKSLDEEFKSRCVVKSSGNAWMNKELTIMWVKRVSGAFSFDKRLLA